MELPNITDLSEVESAIYRYIIQNDEKIALMRVRDLAEGSHTSPTSVMRFIRKMGFDSFPEFKLHYKQKQTAVHEHSPSIDSYFDLLNRKNFKNNLEAQVDYFAEAIIRSSPVIFLGLGASGSIASYASRKIANLGYNSFALSDRSYPISSRLDPKKESLLIFLSVSGNTVEMVDIATQFAGNPLVKIGVITSDPTSRLGEKADYLLDYIGNNERAHIYYDLSSQIPSVFLLELIINSVRQKNQL